jgi:hypothetical protein
MRTRIWRPPCEGVRWPFVPSCTAEEGDEPPSPRRTRKNGFQASQGPEGRGRSATDAVTIPAIFQARLT